MCWHGLYLFKACGHAVVSQQPIAECMHKQVQDQKERTESWSKSPTSQPKAHISQATSLAANNATGIAPPTSLHKRIPSKLPQKRPLTPNIDTASKLPRPPSSILKPLPPSPQAKRTLPAPTQNPAPTHSRNISCSLIPAPASSSAPAHLRSASKSAIPISAKGHARKPSTGTSQHQTPNRAKGPTTSATISRPSTPQPDKAMKRTAKQPAAITTQQLPSPKQKTSRKQKAKSPHSTTSKATTASEASATTNITARPRGCEKSSQHPYRSYLIHSLCTACQRAQQIRLRQIMHSGLMEGILVDEGKWRVRIEGRRVSSTPSTPTRKNVTGSVPGLGNVVDENGNEAAAAVTGRTKAGKGKRTVEELRLVVGLREGRSVLEKREALSPTSPTSTER